MVHKQVFLRHLPDFLLSNPPHRNGNTRIRTNVQATNVQAQKCLKNGGERLSSDFSPSVYMNKILFYENYVF